MTPHASAIRTDISRPAVEVVRAFRALSPTTLADALDLGCVMRIGINPLWPGMPRIAGPAFTVRTARHDNLMLHAAIYLAEPGDVIVVEAQRRGVQGFVIDGVIRDVAESRASGFPLFARGVSPAPRGREGPGEINAPITCGGISVSPGDVLVADEEGIVVVPGARAEEVLARAQAMAAADAAETLDTWEKKHRARVEATLKAKGYRP